MSCIAREARRSSPRSDVARRPVVATAWSQSRLHDAENALLAYDPPVRGPARSLNHPERIGPDVHCRDQRRRGAAGPAPGGRSATRRIGARPRTTWRSQRGIRPEPLALGLLRLVDGNRVPQVGAHACGAPPTGPAHAGRDVARRLSLREKFLDHVSPDREGIMNPDVSSEVRAALRRPQPSSACASPAGRLGHQAVSAWRTNSRGRRESSVMTGFPSASLQATYPSPRRTGVRSPSSRASWRIVRGLSVPIPSARDPAPQALGGDERGHADSMPVHERRSSTG